MATDVSTLVDQAPSVLKVPADLAFVLCITVLVNLAVFLPVVSQTPLRVPLGVIFVLFVPGYTVIAALYPAAPDRDGTPESDTKSARTGTPESGGESARIWNPAHNMEITVFDRFALAIGTSVVVVPSVALLVGLTPFGITLAPVMVAVSVVTIVLSVVAIVRRQRLPADDRFRLPYNHWLETVRSQEFGFGADTRSSAILNVVLAGSIVLAMIGTGVALVGPLYEEEYSTLSILTADEDGELVADQYPETITAGDTIELVATVDNQEQQSMSYTLVVVEQQVDVGPDETVVEEQRELERFETQLEHDTSWVLDHELEPTMTGDDVRIVWLLYPGDEMPETLDTDTAPYYGSILIEVDDSD